MNKLLAVMEHMKMKKIYIVPRENIEPTELPSWMNLLRKKMVDRNTKINIKIFIAKMIINEPKVCCLNYCVLWF